MVYDMPIYGWIYACHIPLESSWPQLLNDAILSSTLIALRHWFAIFSRRYNFQVYSNRRIPYTQSRKTVSISTKSDSQQFVSWSHNIQMLLEWWEIRICISRDMQKKQVFVQKRGDWSPETIIIYRWYMCSGGGRGIHGFSPAENMCCSEKLATRQPLSLLVLSNEATWCCREPTCLCLELVFDLDSRDLWPPDQGSIKLQKNPWKNHIFPTWWPWPLTYDLDLDVWPKYHLGTSSYWIMWP